MKDKLMPVRFLAEKIPAQCEGVIAADPFLLPTKKYPASISPEDQKRFFLEVMKDYEHIANRKAKFDELKLNPYYNALQIKFAYAITCHKAQGGQWDAVFVDQGYLTDEMINMDFLRWLYTACTRATKELFLVNFDSRFYSH